MTTINEKEQLAFNFEMPRYNDKGQLVPQADFFKMKMIDPETGKLKIKVTIPIVNKNMVSSFLFDLFLFLVPLSRNY